MLRISRRRMLRRLTGLAGGALIADLLAACGPAAAPTPTTAPAVVSPPTVPPTPTEEPVPTVVPRPEIIRMYPDGPSRVVHARHPAAWEGETLSPEALRAMLDASLTELTGLDEPHAAWAALFRPQERIAIKASCIRNAIFWTNVPLVMTVTECLQDAGVPAEQIVIYDRESDELEGAGFTINRDGPGVRCYGTDGRYRTGFEVHGYPVKLSEMLFECDALINMPFLKSHSLSGITFALKNHFGTFDQPETFHPSTALVAGIAELNALPPIRDRARLIVGDALRVCLREAGTWPYWREAETGDSIFVGYDPVAVDTQALAHWSEVMTGQGGNPRNAQYRAGVWLTAAAELGLGTRDEANIDVVEVNLA